MTEDRNSDRSAPSPTRRGGSKAPASGVFGTLNPPVKKPPAKPAPPQRSTLP